MKRNNVANSVAGKSRVVKFYFTVLSMEKNKKIIHISTQTNVKIIINFFSMVQITVKKLKYDKIWGKIKLFFTFFFKGWGKFIFF